MSGQVSEGMDEVEGRTHLEIHENDLVRRRNRSLGLDHLQGLGSVIRDVRRDLGFVQLADKDPLVDEVVFDDENCRCACCGSRRAGKTGRRYLARRDRPGGGW